jgi:hypothetical protein
MTMLSQLIGQPTISLDNAEQTGRVEGVEIAMGRIIGVRTNDGLVPSSAIRTYEGDAVTYDGLPATLGADAGRPDSPLGRRVLDEDGDELGRLADLSIQPDGGVASILLDDGRAVDGAALKAVGSYAVIVAALPDTTLTDGALPPPPAGSTPV